MCPADPTAVPGTIHGGCHCGILRYTLAWPDTSAPTLRACGCDYCSRHGAAWTSHSAAPVTLTLDDPGAALAYRFGSGTADFLSCARCGVLVIACCALPDGERAVVNGNTFDSLDPGHCPRVATDFDSEAGDTAARLARRQRNWSPLVRTRA